MDASAISIALTAVGVAVALYALYVILKRIDALKSRLAASEKSVAVLRQLVDDQANTIRAISEPNDNWMGWGRRRDLESWDKYADCPLGPDGDAPPFVDEDWIPPEFFYARSPEERDLHLGRDANGNFYWMDQT